MQTLAFACLAIVWAAFLVPPMLRRRREGRPASSVHSFRRQLSTLERATPGTVLRAPTPSVEDRPAVGGVHTRTAPVRTAPSAVVKRRRDILTGLLAATAVTFLLLVVASSAMTFLLFATCAGALGAYVYALVQIRVRAEEASAKVRVLRPQSRPVAYQSTVRRTVNG
ncbi:MAG: hypothetical protein R2701_04270 [Acidimicrobiales bacterium]